MRLRCASWLVASIGVACGDVGSMGLGEASSSAGGVVGVARAHAVADVAGSSNTGGAAPDLAAARVGDDRPNGGGGASDSGVAGARGIADADAGSGTGGVPGDELAGAVESGAGAGSLVAFGSEASVDAETTTFASIDELLTSCPLAADLDAIDKDFDLVFDRVDTSGPLVCTAAQGSRDLTRPRERAYQALLVIRALEFDAPLPWTSSGLYAWLKATIKGITFLEDMSECCGTGSRGGDYLFVRLGADSVFYATELWANGAGYGLSPLVDLIVHEARHANIGGHTCPDGASDSTFEEMGAWGTEHTFQRWLAYHADPCFLRPTLPPNTKYEYQLQSANAYQLAALEVADRTAMVRFCESAPPFSDPGAEPLPVCEP